VKQLLPVTDHGKSSCSESPYYYSVRHDDVAATRCLIEGGVDVNASFDYDDGIYRPEVLLKIRHNIAWFGHHCSPLVLAIRERSVEHAIALLDAGACPDARLPCRIPPLLPALDEFYLDLVRRLVAAGASVNIYHRRVIGNMSLIVCLHYWHGFDLMLRCGAEVESLFGRRPRRDATAEVDWSDDDSDFNERELGTLATPIPFWRILLASAQVLITKEDVTDPAMAQLLSSSADCLPVNFADKWPYRGASAGCILIFM